MAQKRFGRGIRKEQKDGETGILMEDGDIEGMLDGVRKLIDNTELRRQMGQRGRRVIQEKFSMDKPVTKMAEIFREVVFN